MLVPEAYLDHFTYGSCTNPKSAKRIGLVHADTASIDPFLTCSMHKFLDLPLKKD